MNKDHIKKILSYTFSGVAAAIALLIIVSVFPIPGNIKLFIVQSGSMEPAIKTGSMVLVKPSGNYKIDDVITFGPVSSNNPPKTHRITEIKVNAGTPSYQTQGDANNAPDRSLVASSNVIGKVFLHVPYIGYAIAATKTKYGLLAIILLPASILIYDHTKKIIKETRKLKNKNEK
jgi:signal peptidase I